MVFLGGRCGLILTGTGASPALRHIGLRAEFEAALIVGIIAAFLQGATGCSLARECGSASASLSRLSIAVGAGLDLLERVAAAGAPGRRWRAVIGAVAVVFVTGMIAWMNAHARGLLSSSLRARRADAH